MSYKTLLLVISLSLVLTFIGSITPKLLDKYQKKTQQEEIVYTTNNCVMEECLAIEDLSYPVSKLSRDAEEALIKAIEDEYKAYATYDSVVTKHGQIRPFIMILRAEEQHISSLKSLFDKYGIKIPQNSYMGKVKAPVSVSEACATGVTAEIANSALYKDELLPAVTEYEDLSQVFTNLMNASQQKHLPAFQRCVN